GGGGVPRHHDLATAGAGRRWRRPAAAGRQRPRRSVRTAAGTAPQPVRAGPARTGSATAATDAAATTAAEGDRQPRAEASAAGAARAGRERPRTGEGRQLQRRELAPAAAAAGWRRRRRRPAERRADGGDGTPARASGARAA